MVTLTCKYANGMFEPLGLNFVNGYKQMTEKQFADMRAKDPEYLDDKIRREIILVLSQGEKPKNRGADIKVLNAGVSAPAMPVFKPEPKPVTPGPEVDNDTVVEEDASTLGPHARKVDEGKVTAPQSQAPAEAPPPTRRKRQ